MKIVQKAFGAVALCLFTFGCDQAGEAPQIKLMDDSPVFIDLPASAAARRPADRRYGILSAEYLASAGSRRVGRTVFFKDVGNKQVAAGFVPGLSLDGTDDVSFYIDEKRPSDDLDVSVTSAAISRAMDNWEGLSCSQPSLYRVPFSRRISAGFVSELFGFGGSFSYIADVVHAGWLPGSFFDLLAEDGGGFILAVTFTLIFIDDNGNPTDVDNNRKPDVAWREIYYNDAFRWADGAHFDVETIALHEAGHGLSQAHFGSAFLDAGKGQLHFSPRAVMNAAYSGIQTRIGATDKAGHCSIWSSWPKNGF